MLSKQKQNAHDKIERLTQNSHQKRNQRSSGRRHMPETPQQRNADSYASGPRSGIKTPIRELILDSKPSSPEAKCSNFKSAKKSIQSI